MKSIQLQDNLGMKSIFREEACTPLTVIKGTIIKNIKIHKFEISYFFRRFREDFSRWGMNVIIKQCYHLNVDMNNLGILLMYRF